MVCPSVSVSFVFQGLNDDEPSQLVVVSIVCAERDDESAINNAPVASSSFITSPIPHRRMVHDACSRQVEQQVRTRATAHYQAAADVVLDPSATGWDQGESP
jgi:hypothetical protein